MNIPDPVQPQSAFRYIGVRARYEIHKHMAAAERRWCLDGVVKGDHAAIVCNECRVIVRTVPVADLGKALDEMELGLELSIAVCPDCRRVSLFPGFSQMFAFRCQSCGRGVDLTAEENQVCRDDSSALVQPDEREDLESAG